MRSAFFLIFLMFSAYFCYGVCNFLVFGGVANNQDWYFHFGQAKGEKSDSSYWLEHPFPPNNHYPPVYHFIFSFFTIHPLLFYFVNLVLILVLIPLLLLELFKIDWCVAVYFGGVGLAHSMIYGSLFPQALVLVFFLGYLLYRPNWIAFLVFGICAVFTHSYGLYLFSAIGLMEVLIKLPKSGLFSVGFVSQNQMDLHHFGITLLSLIPLPTLFFGLRESFKKENFFYLGLIGIAFLTSFMELRTLGIAQILLCGLAGQNIEKTKPIIKKGFMLFLIVESAWLILEFVFGTWKYLAFN